MNHTGNKNIEHKQKQYNDSKHHDSQGSCNICAIQLLYWAPQTYRTHRNTIVILGTTLAQHKHLCKYNCYIGASYSYYALLNYYWPTTDKETSTIALTQYTI